MVREPAGSSGFPEHDTHFHAKHPQKGGFLALRKQKVFILPGRAHVRQRAV